MTQIRMEYVVGHLSHDMKRALEEAVRRQIPEAYFDRNALFKDSQKAVHRKCSVWQTIPDRLVRD